MITSPHNDKLKEIPRLNRRREVRFVAEGEDLVAAADAAGWPAVYRLEAGVDVEPALLDEGSVLGSRTRVLAVYERRGGGTAARPRGVALWGGGDPRQRRPGARAALPVRAAGGAPGP